MENDLIKRFAEIQGIDYAEAEKLIGAETDEEIMKKITDFTITKINGGVRLNRAQRRALAKKNKGNKAKLSQNLKWIRLMRSQQSLIIQI